VRLTPAGETVYAAARRMLDEDDRLLRALDSAHEGQVTA
jgi:DNA-binding transcriptional LysR family regulator